MDASEEIQSASLPVFTHRDAHSLVKSLINVILDDG